MTNKSIIIAKITSAHGIKGLVKISSFTENFEKYSSKMFDAKNHQYDIKVINHVPGNMIIAKISGVDDRNQAELLRNTELFIKRTDLKKPKNNEFYYTDLIGIEVRGLDNKKIGTVITVDDFGAGGVIEIKFDDNKIENFSFTNQIFPQVDIESGYLIIDIPGTVELKSDE